MCWLCWNPYPALAPNADFTSHEASHRWSARRGFLLAAASTASGLVSTSASAQVEVGKSSALRNLVPAEKLEGAAQQQYGQMLEQARAKGALVSEQHPHLQALRVIAQRIIPYTHAWNPRAKNWHWEVNLIGSQQINAFCMPGGKIAFFTGILDKLKLNSAEAAMVMGHEMAHALREHGREQLAKTQATNLGLSLGARLLGLGDVGELAANLGAKLLSLKYSRDDETDADLVGLELAARAAFDPQASVSLWQKMTATNGSGGPAFLSTHPSSPNRITELQANIPKVLRLYEQAKR